METFPPTSDINLTQTKSELAELGVSAGELKYYVKLSHYRKTVSELTDSEMDLGGEIFGDTQNSSARFEEMGVESCGSETHGSAPSFQDSFGVTRVASNRYAGSSEAALFGRARATQDSVLPSGAGSRFGKYRSLVRPSLEALGVQQTRGVQKADTNKNEQTLSAGSLGQLTELVTGVVSRLDATESRRGRFPDILESGAGSETPAQNRRGRFPDTLESGVGSATALQKRRGRFPATLESGCRADPGAQKRGGPEVAHNKKRARLTEALQYARSEFSQDDMEPEDVAQGYTDFLLHMSNIAGFEELIISQKQTDSLAMAFSGRKVLPPATCLALNEESSAVLENAMKVPRLAYPNPKIV